MDEELLSRYQKVTPNSTTLIEERYKMALEAILEIVSISNDMVLAQSIARKALRKDDKNA